LLMYSLTRSEVRDGEDRTLELILFDRICK